ncbi:MAG TPA: alpha/beta fold hydrolase [Saprospiraceae bacterium]|nr:alpha/beta fold hydrolase [Saprospiraceae bacterium]
MQYTIQIIIILVLSFLAVEKVSAQTNRHLFQRKKIIIEGINISYLDEGQGNTLLFFHGIPTNADIWQGIIDNVSPHYRTIALDLPGYGESDMPNNFSIETNYHYIKAFVDSLNLKDITIVVHDLGSLYGIKYAIENSNNIKNVILFESVFMPTAQWYKQLPFSAKLMFRLLGNKRIASKWMHKKNKVNKLLLKMGTKRKMTKSEIKLYTKSFDDSINRRLILLHGPSPTTMPKKGISVNEGDFADEFDKNAAGLKKLSETKPMLLFFASPGMVTRKKAVIFANNNLRNLTTHNLGKGKHFLQEDYPKEISAQIIFWLKNEAACK